MDGVDVALQLNTSQALSTEQKQKSSTGEDDPLEPDHILPSSNEVAQGFLAEEPEEERHELEAAIQEAFG